MPEKTEALLDQLAGVTIYRKAKQDAALQALIRFGQSLMQVESFCHTLEAYSDLCAALYHSPWKGDLPNHCMALLLQDQNIFSLACAKAEYHTIPAAVRKAVIFDLNAFYAASLVTEADCKGAMRKVYPDKAALIETLPGFTSQNKHLPPEEAWGDHFMMFADYYKKNKTAFLQEE